jgi:hypothetical protein
VVLDGLDEVTSPIARIAVINAITNFIDEADARDADVMLVVTSRPTGYDQALSTNEFMELKLGFFTKQQAYEYGRRSTEGRLGSDPDRREVVLKRFEDELKTDNIERLARTPLQVLIITLILESNRTLPLTRYGLFSAHYKRLLKREQNKANHLADFLNRHADSVTAVHEEVGFRLHLRAQDPEASDTLGILELREIAEGIFSEEGFRGSDLDTLVDELVKAATTRLVLLVAGGVSITDEATVRFELRTFQELMAARRLTTYPDLPALKARLARCGPHPHWRNVFLLMVGRLFGRKHSPERDAVLEAVMMVDAQEAWPGWLVPMAPVLAAAALDDGIAAAAPRWRLGLIEQALNSVGKFPAPPTELNVVADGLSSVARDPDFTNMIRNALHAAHRGTPAQRETATIVLREARWPEGFPAPSRTQVDRMRLTDPASPGAISMRTLITSSNTGAVGLPRSVLRELDQVSVHYSSTGEPIELTTPAEPLSAWSAVTAALAGGETATLLRRLILSIDAQSHWLVTTMFARSVYTSLSRQPIDPADG